MKVSAFHLMPYRELPADFEQRYPRSAAWHMGKADPDCPQGPYAGSSRGRVPLVCAKVRGKPGGLGGYAGSGLTFGHGWAGPN